MKVAITGASGQLGQRLNLIWGDAAIPLTRAQFDICDADAVPRLQELAPQVLVNCAAYTNVDQAEVEREACLVTNADAVGRLADACQRLRIAFVQISTDYVFGGDVSRRRPYRETDPTSPQSVYGISKQLSEAYAQRCARHLIIRTCGLYQFGYRNFVTSILELARRGTTLRVVDDQQCSPSYVADVAAAIHYLVDTGAEGIYHVVNHGSTSWYELAREVLQRANIRANIHPISSAEYGARAERPAYSVLDTQKYDAMPGPPLRDWREAVAAAWPR